MYLKTHYSQVHIIFFTQIVSPVLMITTRPEQLLHCSGAAACICLTAGSDFLLSHFAHAFHIIGPTYMLIY